MPKEIPGHLMSILLPSWSPPYHKSSDLSVSEKSQVSFPTDLMTTWSYTALYRCLQLFSSLFFTPLSRIFFFIEKKDKSLRVCIDYRQLDEITIKKQVPLSLIDPVFEQLNQAKIFNKQDLQNVTCLQHPPWAILRILLCPLA